MYKKFILKSNRKNVVIFVLVLLVILLIGLIVGLFFRVRHLESNLQKGNKYFDFLGFGDMGEINDLVGYGNEESLEYESLEEVPAPLVNQNEEDVLPEPKPYQQSYASPNSQRKFVLDVVDSNIKLSILGTNVVIDNVANAKWSSDSQYILYSKKEGIPADGHSDFVDSGNLNIVRYDGVGEKEIFNSENMNVVDAVSNGSRIAFVTTNEIYTANIDGSELTMIQSFDSYWANFGIMAAPEISLSENTVSVDLSEFPDVAEVVTFQL